MRGVKSIGASLAAAASRLGFLGRPLDASPERAGAGASAAAEGSKQVAAEVAAEEGPAQTGAGGNNGRRGRQPLAVEFLPITIVCRNLRWVAGRWSLLDGSWRWLAHGVKFISGCARARNVW